MFAALVWFALAVVAAKWALDLGYGQVRQAIWFVFALACPPLALLILYGQAAHQRTTVAGTVVAS